MQPPPSAANHNFIPSNESLIIQLTQSASGPPDDAVMRLPTILTAAIPACLAITPFSLHPNPRIHAQREATLTAAALNATHRPSYNFSVPIDHFHNDTRYEPHADGTFPLRYWIDDTHYRPGGPVIMIGSGELTSVLRLPYIEQGIGKILAEATGGLAVLLEHRYYGSSYPVPDLSPPNMRFLSTEQALADTAYFVRHIRYPGLEHLNLTSPTTPYIVYGGSYAGAFAALLRKIYPDDFAGAISGSGVPQVIDDWWAYLEAARHFVHPSCVNASAAVTDILDAVLLGDDRDAVRTVKRWFQLEDLPDDDFAYTLHWGLMSLQATHWDPDIDEADLAQYCAAITSSVPWYASTRTLGPEVRRILRLAGRHDGDQRDEMEAMLLNFIGATRKTISELQKCEQDNLLGEQCLSKRGAIDDESIPQGMLRAWAYQTCTQWAYFVTGTGTPDGMAPLMSRLVTYEYATMWCPDVFKIPAQPDMDSINKYGGFNFSHSRLAFVDGEHDPWRQAGVHALGRNEDRESTTDEPFLLVEGGVHHWDQFGSKPDARSSWVAPENVQRVQQEEVRFVKAWLDEWREERGMAREEDFGLEL
ncbi:uncharacterized protein J7T54_007626 [Emericellopsis cladophorae]|uniref:Extracelular serine carboxypeptidase n=1 Tax=Emericellopsis cladophorae TaxID=2686198 RepID=A0A9Q0BBN6_9HYPO|nr:uncharacterized protein J7T54_007626 [Emericellopsis cladophorae]KAI6778685.1 hypothetical protein J7T54_007626 [Emericellopsis cladophorae]